MSDKPKKNYIKYTPEQLAAVPTPAQKEEAAETGSMVRSAGVGAVIGGVTGGLLGVSPGKGAAIGGTTGAVQDSTRKK